MILKLLELKSNTYFEMKRELLSKLNVQGKLFKFIKIS